MPTSSKTSDPGPLRVALATLSGNLYLIAGTLLLATTATLFGWLGPKGRFVFGCARFWSRGLLAASGVRAAARFEVPLDGERQCVFMANHQSLFDIPVLLSTLPGPTRFLAKRSLFQIPIFGWALAMGGFISIDRRDLSRARGSFQAAVEGLGTGGSLLVFPEGTRSLDLRLRTFKRGGFLLALKSGLPIVPIGLRGTLAVQRKGSFSIRPRRVEARFGRPIEVSEFGVRDKERLAAVVRDRIGELAGIDI